MKKLRLFLLLAVGFLAVAVTATAEPISSMGGVPFKGVAPVTQKKLRLAINAPYRLLALDAVTANEGAALAKAAAITDKRLPLQIGYQRIVPSRMAQVDLASLDWQGLADGSRVAHILLDSPAAAAIRAELVLSGSADGLSFRFGSDAPGAPVFGPYSWTELEAAARWSPVLEGSSVFLELELAAGASTAGKTLGVPQISHLILAGADLGPDRLKRASDIGRAGSCNIDIACLSNPSPDLLLTAASVAQIVYTDSGRTYLCTGSLLNSRTASGVAQQIPYFVTAHHCVGTAPAASTINFYWFFQAATCNSLAIPNYQITAGGASLLYTSYDVDLTFLRMNNNPPSGTFLAGWDAMPVFPDTNIIALHHPQGDLKKYAAGKSVDFAHDFDDVQSPGNYVPQGMYLRVTWSAGTTEVGSSGSGVYARSPDGQYQLRGVLHGGAASCQDLQGLDYFSRFDLAYPSISQFLSGVGQPVAGGNAIEYYNLDLDHYFLTSFPAEVQSVESGGAGRGWVRTGYTFRVGGGAPLAPSNASVCRFYGNPQFDLSTGKRKGPNSHFYTAVPAECAQVQRDPGWVFETGNAFAIQVPAGASCPTGTIPVFRLYNNGFAANDSNHRYTTSAVVYQFMLTQRWVGEQTVMCALAPAA